MARTDLLAVSHPAVPVDLCPHRYDLGVGAVHLGLSVRQTLREPPSRSATSSKCGPGEHVLARDQHLALDASLPMGTP
jgi:hypothetical protein